MIIDLTTPKDMREAIEALFKCQKSTENTLKKVTEALEQLAVWMTMAENINVMINEKLAELEDKTNLIMKATRFSQSPASSK